MRVLLTDNAHLFKTPDGNYYTPSIYGQDFFQRYLSVFEEVRFMAKTKYMDTIDVSKYLSVKCNGVEIYELPWYQGLRGMFKELPELIRRYKYACDGCDCYIFRVAQLESFFTYLLAKTRNKPYAVEVVNDPNSFHDLPSLLRWACVWFLKKMIHNANGVAYVTEEHLQKLYPSRAKTVGESLEYFESSYSSVELNGHDIREPKKYSSIKKPFEIIHVANNISGEMKGHRIVIRTLKVLVDQGYDVKVTFIGDGPSVSDFRTYAESLGVLDRVNFEGRLPSKGAVIDRLAQSDLFLFPSQSEGLPRSVIEAQAAGLPCLASPVGGTRELLNERYLFQPNDFEGFACRIMQLLNNPTELETMSRENILTARKYTKSKLDSRRRAFYLKLRDLTERMSVS